MGSALSLLIDNNGKSPAMIEAVGSLAAAMKRAMKGARARADSAGAGREG